MTRRLTGATLFSGIGAPEVAAPFIDWRWMAELDDFSSAVLAHRFPGVPNLGDVTELNGVDLDAIDLLAFGSPCQSFSTAGARRGLADPRGDLAIIALALARQIRPRWILFENVPGLLSSAGGNDFAAFLGACRECGYSGAWRVLDARYFGVPQRRRRIFFVGCLGDDWRPPSAVLFEPASLSRLAPPSGAPEPEVAEPARGDTGEGRVVDRWPPDIAPTLDAAFGHKRGLELQHAMQGAGLFTPFEDGVRRITPREAERLQGLPDDWTLVPFKGKPAPDRRRYEAVGNSMAVPVVRWILSRLEAEDARLLNREPSAIF